MRFPALPSSAARALLLLALAACSKSDSTAPSRPVVAQVTVHARTSTPTVGDTLRLTAEARDADGGVIAGRGVAWSADAPGVVRVSAEGTLTALARGTAVVAATVDGVRGTLSVSVQDPVPPPPPPPVVGPAEGVGFEFLEPTGVFDEGHPSALTLVYRSPHDVAEVQFKRVNGTILTMTRRTSYTYALELPASLLSLAATNPVSLTKLVGWVLAPDGSGGTVQLNIWIPALPASAPRAVRQALAPGAQRSEYVMNVRDDAAAFGLQPKADQQRVGRAAYQFLPDSLDFLALVDQALVHYNRTGGATRNAVTGINVATVDFDASYGSAGRLQGHIVYPLTTLFTMSDVASSHEMGHRWLAFFSNPSLALNGGAHWRLGDLASGVMGYSNPVNFQGQQMGHLVPAGTDAWTIDCAAGPVFNDVELYAMGLLPIDSVGTHFVFQDQAQSPACGATLLGPVARFDGTDIVRVYGPRSPAWPDTQRRFRLGVVVVSRGRLLDDLEMSWYEEVTRRGESRDPQVRSFWTLTGGRGELVTRLP